MTASREQLMRNVPLPPEMRITISWWTCPKCGALTPLIEHSSPPRLIRPQCCGLAQYTSTRTPQRTRLREQHGSEYRFSAPFEAFHIAEEFSPLVFNCYVRLPVAIPVPPSGARIPLIGGIPQPSLVAHTLLAITEHGASP